MKLQWLVGRSVGPLSWRGWPLTDVTPAVRAARQGPGNYSTEESALSLHLDQAGGDWNKEEKAVDSEITHRGRNERGVGERAANRVLPREITPEGCAADLRGRGGELAHAQREPKALISIR